MKKNAGKKVLDVLNGRAFERQPVWLMRQAGRYLPEYRQLRARAGSFWTMCMSPEMAAEITLQPIRRFGFDAAILFSDILVVPFALGMKVRFEENIGPILDPVRNVVELERNPEVWRTRLAPAYEALGRVREELDGETALLGFAGAPWTLATYMVEGRGSADQRAAKLWGYRDPESFAQLLDLLSACVAAHLIAQLDAGADAVQIFESWAHGVADSKFDSWVVEPAKKIVSQVRQVHPEAKIIGFPRATSMAGYERYAAQTGVDAVSIDTATPIGWAAQTFGGHSGVRIALQGNLDPIVLIAGGKALDQAVDQIVDATRSVPHIFNLGHGILPETPVENVEALLKRIRG